MESLRRAARARLADTISSYLRQHYPDACAALGDEGRLRAFVVRGLDRGHEHGIDTAGAAMVYLELLVQFGEDFQRSPLQPWARNILAHPDLPGPVKAEALRDRHFDETRGRVLVAF